MARHLVSIAIVLTLAPLSAGQDLGTVGLGLQQLYDDTPANHRGPLVVLQIVPDSPAAKAGIHCSDFVTAVNGVPVSGRDFSEIFYKDIRGPVGGTVRLSVARYDGSEQQIALVRTPYPPHLNPASDPFTYKVPGSWTADARYPFP